ESTDGAAVLRARRDPPTNDVSLSRRQRRLAFGRHELVVLRVERNTTQQLRQLRVPGDDHLAALTATHDAGIRREHEAVFLLVLVVTALTVLFEDRSDDVDERVGLLDAGELAFGLEPRE